MKAAFRHILLAALLLRALVPMGWMPGVAQLGEAAFIICNADGSLSHGAPGKDDAKPSQPCAFAAAMQLFAAPEAAEIAPPSVFALAVASLAATPSPALAAAYAPQAPRAPPFA